MDTLLQPTVENSIVAKSKRIIERSAAYPAITIEEALSLTEVIYKNFPGNPPPTFTREDAAAVLKKSVGNIQRDVAASGHYALLNTVKGGYQISNLFKTIYKPLSDEEKRKCLLEAFSSPKLYQELIAKLDGHVIPQELPTHLIRFHKIAEKAAQEVADIFISNAKYVGAFNDHGILNYKNALEKSNDNGIQYAEVTTEPNYDTSPNNHDVKTLELSDVTPPSEIPNDLGKKLPPIPEAEEVRIPLSGKRFAFLYYPSDIKKKDIDILRKQLDLLDLLAE